VVNAPTKPHVSSPCVCMWPAFGDDGYFPTDLHLTTTPFHASCAHHNVAVINGDDHNYSGPNNVV
jgi:hypothetical protein